MSSSFAYSNSQSQRHANNHPRASLYPSHNTNHYNSMPNCYMSQNRPMGATPFYGETRGSMPRPYWGNPLHPQHSHRASYAPFGNNSVPYSYLQTNGFTATVPPSNHPSAHMRSASILGYQQQFSNSDHQPNSIQSTPMHPFNPSHIDYSNYSACTSGPSEVVAPSNSSSLENSSSSILNQQTIAAVVQHRLIQQSGAWAEVNEIAIPLSPLPPSNHNEKVIVDTTCHSSYLSTGEYQDESINEESQFYIGFHTVVPFDEASYTALPGTDISMNHEKNFIPGIDKTPPDGFSFLRDMQESPNHLEHPTSYTLSLDPVNFLDPGQESIEKSKSIQSVQVYDLELPYKSSKINTENSALPISRTNFKGIIEPVLPNSLATAVHESSCKPSHNKKSASPAKVFSKLPINQSDSVLFIDSTNHITNMPTDKHDSSTTPKDEEKSFGLKYWFMKATVPNTPKSSHATQKTESDTKKQQDEPSESQCTKLKNNLSDDHVISYEFSDEDALTTEEGVTEISNLKERKSKRRIPESETCFIGESTLPDATTSKRKRSQRNVHQTDCLTTSKNSQHNMTHFTSISLGDLRSSLKQTVHNIRSAYVKEMLESDLSEIKRHYDDARSELHHLVNQRKNNAIPQQCMTCSILCMRYAITQDLHSRHASVNGSRTSIGVQPDVSFSSLSWDKQKSSSFSAQSTKANASLPTFSLASSPANNSSGSSIACIYAKCESQLRDIAKEFDRAMRIVVSNASRIESKRLDIVRQMGILGIIAARATLGMDLYHSWMATNAEEFQIPALPTKKSSTGNRTGASNNLPNFPLPLSHVGVNMNIEYPASNASHETHQESPASTLSFQSGNGSSGGGGPGSVPSTGSAVMPHLTGSLASYRVVEYAARSEEIWEFFQQSRQEMLSKNCEDTQLMEDEFLQYFPWGLDGVSQYRDDSVMILCMLDALSKIVTLRLSY